VDASITEERGTPCMLVLCELCPEGTLFDLLQKYNGKLSEAQILFIMKDVSK